MPVSHPVKFDFHETRLFEVTGTLIFSLNVQESTLLLTSMVNHKKNNEMIPHQRMKRSVHSFLDLLSLWRQHERHKHLNANLIAMPTTMAIATRKNITSSK